ncbi:uncharacterized protein ARMOST_14473 [Armillaria ostoyae]|uniref:Uncharacterized protein n=1 Tax=Armillaria ostoyae TaxID=47428 RepID=A0A284RQL9_ARMOS|nr:uncharacterized protein ARMOST_14473 [Armillaria ostoyae]
MVLSSHTLLAFPPALSDSLVNARASRPVSLTKQCISRDSSVYVGLEREAVTFQVHPFALQGSEYQFVLKNSIQREPDLLQVAGVRKNDGSWGCAGAF